MANLTTLCHLHHLHALHDQRYIEITGTAPDRLTWRIGIKPDGSALMVVGPGEKVLSPRPPAPRITPLQLLWMHLELDGRLVSNFG